MDKIPLVVLLLLPFSLAGLASARAPDRPPRRRGAAAAPLAMPDLVLACLLSAFFGLLAWSGFQAPHREISTLSASGRSGSGRCCNPRWSSACCSRLCLRRVPFRETFGVRGSRSVASFVYALGWILLVLPLLCAVMALVASRLPKDVEEQLLVIFFRSEVRQHHYAGMISMVLTAAVLAPLQEEFLFRGYLYPVFKRYLTGWGSAFATALLFALLHANVTALPGLFLLALCLTAAYEWSGSLLVPIGMHALFNSVSLLSMYLGTGQLHP